MTKEKWTEDANTINEILANIKHEEYHIIEYNDRRDLKNDNFKVNWKASFDKICKMVKLLDTSNYLYTIMNKDDKIKTDRLHIFKKTYGLVDVFARSRDVCIFVKIGVIANKYVLLVSFHENEPK